MSKKLEEKKKQKREALLMAAFSLFTSKGINETSISDIASKANMAKGTFYLYFKDKYDIRDKLITEQARQLFDNATIELMEEELPTLEKKVLFIADRVIDKLQENKILIFRGKRERSCIRRKILDRWNLRQSRLGSRFRLPPSSLSRRSRLLLMGERA